VTTIADLTIRTMFGQRRGVLLVALPLLVVVLALVLRVTTGGGETASVAVMAGLGFALVVPLLALLSGTGAIGSEIDDRSIVHLLAKPVPRWHIVVVKTVVAAVWAGLAGGLCVAASGLLLDPDGTRTAIAFGVGSALAAITYATVFVALSVFTSHAVVAGLVYALVWETLLGNLTPGVRRLSVQQWALSVTDRIQDTGDVVPSEVGLPFGLAMLVLTTALALVLGSQRLRSLTLSSAE
jgi:ABC-2 type transport system permease protein